LCVKKEGGLVIPTKWKVTHLGRNVRVRRACVACMCSSGGKREEGIGVAGDGYARGRERRRGEGERKRRGKGKRAGMARVTRRRND